MENRDRTNQTAVMEGKRQISHIGIIHNSGLTCDTVQLIMKTNNTDINVEKIVDRNLSPTLQIPLLLSPEKKMKEEIKSFKAPSYKISRLLKFYPLIIIRNLYSKIKHPLCFKEKTSGEFKLESSNYDCVICR